MRFDPAGIDIDLSGVVAAAYVVDQRKFLFYVELAVGVVKAEAAREGGDLFFSVFGNEDALLDADALEIGNDLIDGIKNGIARRFSPLRILSRLSEHTKVVLLMTFLYALGTTNAGTAVRHRAKFLPVLVLVAAYPKKVDDEMIIAPHPNP